MKRIQIGGGVWFDADAAQCYGESRHFDGRNHISDATGDQWLHEELYRTRSGSWILHEWSQWQGGHDRYRQLSPAEAARWLISQGHSEAAELAEPGSVAAAEL